MEGLYMAAFPSHFVLPIPTSQQAIDMDDFGMRISQPVASSAIRRATNPSDQSGFSFTTPTTYNQSKPKSSMFTRLRPAQALRVAQRSMASKAPISYTPGPIESSIHRKVRGRDRAHPADL
jgi:hypothetical protein